MNKATIALVVFGVAAVGSVAEAKPKIGILGLQPIDDSGGVDDQLNLAANLLTDNLRSVAVQNKPLRYDLSQARDGFLEVKILYDCSTEAPECMQRIGKELGVDFLLHGAVERIAGKGYEVRIGIFDVNRKVPEGRAEEIVPARAIGDQAEARKWATLIWDKALGRVSTGTLLIKTNAIDGQIYVDSKRVGRVVEGEGRIPLVEGGSRTVRIDSKKGSAERTVDVVVGEEVEVELKVGAGDIIGDGDGDGDGDKDEGDPRTKWKVGFYVGAIVTAGVGGAGLYFGQVKTRSIQSDQNGLSVMAPMKCDGPITGTDAATYQRKCDEGEDAARLGERLGFATIVPGVATLVLGYFAFFRSNGEASQETSASKKKKKRAEPVVRWLPVGPGDIGASLEVTF